MLVSLQYPKAYNAPITLSNYVSLEKLPNNDFFGPIIKGLQSMSLFENTFYAWSESGVNFPELAIGSLFLISIQNSKTAFLLELIYKFKDETELFARHVNWTKPYNSISFKNVLLFNRIDKKNDLNPEFYQMFNKQILVYEGSIERNMLTILKDKYHFKIPNGLQNKSEKDDIVLKSQSINKILFGPPGTGKTYQTKEKAINILSSKKMDKEEINKKYDELYQKGKIKFITFHPSYSYEDFIEGIRPKLDENSPNIGFEHHSGVFKDMALKALNELLEDKIASWLEFKGEKQSQISLKVKEIVEKGIPNEKNYVLIIDEINRGDISKVFGELITLIEKDKRIGEDNQLIVQLPYTKHNFCLPPNLYILGTMNTADRSLALIDIALRRRFDFEEMPPKLNELKNNPELFGSAALKGKELFNESINALINLNEILGKNPDIGKDKKIGHAFLCNLKNEGELQPRWENKIMPLIEEYYYFDKQTLSDLIGNIYSISNGWDFTKTKDLIKKFSSISA